MKIIISLITILLSYNSVFAFTLVGSSVATYEDGAINIYVGDQACTNVTESPAELEALVQDAIEKFWDRVSTSSLELKMAGQLNVDSSFYTDQICNSSSIIKPIHDMLPGSKILRATNMKSTCVPAVDDGILIVCNTNGSTFNTPNKLAVTLPNNVSGSTIVGSVIAINDIASTVFNNQSYEEKVSIIAHEIGHAFGLGHSAFEDSLMYAESLSGRGTLGRDDWDGATYLYPKEQGPAALCGTIEDISQNKPKGPYFLSMAILLGLIFIHRFRKDLLK